MRGFGHLSDEQSPVLLLRADVFDVTAPRFASLQVLTLVGWSHT